MDLDRADKPPKRTLTEEAYDAIKRRIIELHLPPGAPITESALAVELSLSKTPVRDALARLQREDLVELTHRCGYRVSCVTLKDVGDSFAMRILLEGEAAARAARRSLRPEEVQALRRLAGMDAHAPILAPGSPRANVAFHMAVARAGANYRLVRALEGLLDHVERMYFLARSMEPEDESAVDPGHEEIVETILRSDADVAREAMTAHLRSSQHMVTEALLLSDSLQSANVAAGAFSRGSREPLSETGD